MIAPDEAGAHAAPTPGRPETPEVAREDGSRFALQPLKVCLQKLDSEREIERSDGALGLSLHLKTGVTQDDLSEIELNLMLALNDISLRVRREAFDAYQILRSGRHKLVD